MRTRDVVVLALASAAIAVALVAAPSLRAPAPRAPQETPVSAAPGPAPEPPPPPPTAASTPLPPWAVASPASAAACPDGMLLVDALHCPYAAHRCADGGARGAPCHRYVPQVLCEGDRRRLRFCVDRLEYPGVEGARPVAGVSFEEAERACAAEDKRLCTVREWELACEGPGVWPLPTGVRRDPRVCTVDRARFSRAGLDPAGLRLGCASPFAVIDQLGGVDEWVVDEVGGEVRPPLRWVLAGGSSASGRACREHLRPPTGAARDDAGFRCCADAAAAAADDAPRPASRGARRDGDPEPPKGWVLLDVPRDPPVDPPIGLPPGAPVRPPTADHDGSLPTRPGLD